MFLHAAKCNVNTANRGENDQFLITSLISGYRNLPPKDEAFFDTRYYRSISVGALKEPQFGTQPYLLVPRVRTKQGEAAFLFYAPRIWNSLPEDVRQARTLTMFKSRLKTVLFSCPYDN